MNTIRRQSRDLEIAKFLCTEVGKRTNGKPRYHTEEEASVKYDLSYSHTSRLKKALVNEVEGIRRVKE